MKWHSLTSLILAIVVSTGYSREPLFEASRKREAVRTTAYTHTEADHLKYGRKTAAGTTLRNDRAYTSAAADWSKYPLGTKFKIDGMETTFVVDDYGRALVGTETIDLYHPSKSSMNRWGVRHVDIEVVEMGDFERSREILAQRTKFAHVRAMLAGIDEQAKPDGKGWSIFKSSKNSPTPVLAPDPPKPPVPAAPATPTQPPLQFAAKTPSPKPAPAVVPNPGPLPAALIAAAPASNPAPTPAPVKPAAPTPGEIIAAGMTPATVASSAAPPPAASVQDPPLVARKVRPLSIELASSSPEVTISSGVPGADAAVVPAEPRKRSFRPL